MSNKTECQDKRELVTNCDQLQDNEGDVEFRKRLAEGLRNGTFMTADEFCRKLDTLKDSLVNRHRKSRHSSGNISR